MSNGSFTSFTERGEFFILEVEYMGEGYNGDYDSSDPEDEKLLRFTLYTKDGYQSYMNIGSVCTNITCDINLNYLRDYMKYLLKEIENNTKVTDGNSPQSYNEMGAQFYFRFNTDGLDNDVVFHTVAHNTKDYLGWLEDHFEEF